MIQNPNRNQRRKAIPRLKLCKISLEGNCSSEDQNTANPRLFRMKLESLISSVCPRGQTRGLQTTLRRRDKVARKVVLCLRRQFAEQGAAIELQN
jgi:hypothetical protein